MPDPTTAASPLIERFSIGSVELPIRYTDGSALACIYRVDLADARAVMTSACFEPLPLGGKAMAQLMALEYRQTSVGPYNELGVLVLARRTGSSPSAVRSLVKPASANDAGWYVVNLPVTTGFTCASGRELWGFPKYVTRIDTEFTRDSAEVILGEELVIEHRAHFGVTLSAPPYVFFSELDGRPLRTVVPMDHRIRMGGARSVRIHVTADGPTASTVRRLGLERRRPMIAVRGDHLKFTLPLGDALGSAPIRIG
jgi:Acetoacetate decarboxylase (ADC).